MKKQNGGLKLAHPSKQGFQAVYDMINSSSGRLKLLTYESLKGFMITLDVDPDDSEYLALDGNRFTKKVTSFILKFAVITPDNDTNLPVYNRINKLSETKDSFFDEAKLQQHIWKKSISGGRPEICPPVANFSLFDNNNSKELLTFLKGKTTGSAKNIFKYLFKCVYDNPTYEIGVIIMPKVEDSITFGDFLDLPDGTVFQGITLNTEYKNTAYVCVTSQIARLFIDVGVIHFDLHAYNALIYLTPTNEIKCLLIDFGRASDIMSGTNDEYLNIDDKNEFKNHKDNYFKVLFNIQKYSQNDDTKKDYMLSLLSYIARNDYFKNQEKFNFNDIKRYQMNWYDDYPKDPIVPVNAFNILLESTTTMGTKITGYTIQNYERQGYLIHFNNDVSSFIVPFPGPPTSSTDCDSGNCVISGGRKNKKTIQNKNNKKQVKSRRIR
jgi:hypothetical protein